MYSAQNVQFGILKLVLLSQVSFVYPVLLNPEIMTSQSKVGAVIQQDRENESE